MIWPCATLAVGWFASGSIECGVAAHMRDDDEGRRTGAYGVVGGGDVRSMELVGPLKDMCSTCCFVGGCFCLVFV